MNRTVRLKSFLSACIFASSQAFGAAPDPNDRYRNLELFQKVLQFVEKNYVESVKNEALIQGAIKGMLETLDPHSNFLNAEVYRDMKIETTGRFGGIGVEVGMKDDVLTIVSPMEDSPAWKAGIQPGDKIVRINSESTKGLTMAEAVSRMHGKEGSSVNLTIFRKGWKKFRDFQLKRKTIQVKSVKHEEVEPQFGYVRLYSFNENAAQDVKKAIAKLESKRPLQGLVFDLRTNPGGLLDQAVDVSSLFIDEGVVVTTMGRDSAQKDVKFARKGMARKDLPLVVLVNSSTASAAEIVAAALQDHRRAMILGDVTFGKGSVQTIIDLGQELGLKLTIAKYYTPSGASIQERGVIPDIILEEYDPKLLAQARVSRESTREKDLRGHLVNTEKEEQKSKKNAEEFSIREMSDAVGVDSKSIEEEDGDLPPFQFKPKEDYQVQQAIKYLKSFEVFKKIQR